MHKENIVIIGIGNQLVGDDGAGPFVIKILREKKCNVDLVELSTPGYSILTYIENKDFVIIIDAANFGGKPGEIRRALKQNVKNIKKSSRLNLHESNVLDVLDYAQNIGFHPEKVIIYCIQAKTMKMSSTLSSEVKEAAYKVAEMIEKELVHNGLNK